MDRIYARLGLPIVSDMMSDEYMQMIVWELENVLADGVKGDVVEFGCNMGTASVFLQKVLLELGGGRKLWCYDSFKGLPPRGPEDRGWFGKSFLAGPREKFDETFSRCGLPLPEVREGWFRYLSGFDLPGSICFAFLDCDLYESMIDAMRLVLPRMSPGGKLLLHDALAPGVQRAVADGMPESVAPTEWMNRKGFGILCARRV
jgi:O-methyltransferase